MLIVHDVVLDKEFFRVHHALMDTAIAALHAIASDPDAPPQLSLVARLGLDGRRPTGEEWQALGDQIDVALYLEERELGI
ncbi:hypothetical protein MTIM_01550 [Mycobacterium timonense]|uniref:Uncharacterized protein n=1 Tax=Mycobacterium timonense TaxID=701043 RepID=A0A7I9Z0B7_9MYCO|nr:hypothetical protein MTIM_01550 [Mycobacterium timonense]